MRCGFYEKEITPPLGDSIPGYFEPTDDWNMEFSNDRIWS